MNAFRPHKPLSFPQCTLGLIMLGLAILQLVAVAAATDPKLEGLPTPSWGKLQASTNGSGTILLEVKNWPTDGKLTLPTPFPQITSARLTSESSASAVTWVFNQDASQLVLEVLTIKPEVLPATILLETAESSSQFVDGRITFSALDSQVTGMKAKLESHPGNYRIGFWSDPSDAVSWNYKPTRWGMYDVELTFSADGGNGTEITVEIAGKTLKVERPSTGSWYRYTTVNVGRIYLEKSDPFTLKVSCSKLTGGAAMNLKAVTLRPAPEGAPISQSEDGSVTLPAGQARTHSVMMRYEPAKIKNCLGYWANVNDWADWGFTTLKPGTFELELWQGCGKGQGGSDVSVEVDGHAVEFTVEETGHFQIFLPRKLGRVQLATAGVHNVAIKPKRKQAGAIMDIRQVRLLPVPQTAAETVPPTMKALLGARRVVFLGDSITYAGEWIEFVEAYIHLNYPDAAVDFINVGLPSETVSGLSEPGHAGGAFPRSGLHERLQRVLEKLKPDVVVACYGMNDGIYYPFGKDRFQKFQDGMKLLRERAAAAGARVIHVTPPTFDSFPLKGRTLPAGLPEYKSPYEGYNQVLDRYSEWLVSQRAQGWDVVDIHGPMNRFIAEARKTDPKFILAGDGVHANSQGHWLMAREFLNFLGAGESVTSAAKPDVLIAMHPRGKEILDLTRQRQRVRKDAWLTYAGHLRPGMAKGKPLLVAEREGSDLARRIFEMTDSQIQGRHSRWYGFERVDFQVAGKNVTVVAPKKIASGHPWAWHGEFFGHKPNPDIALLGRGFHIVYMSVPDMLGAPGAVELWNACYKELTTQYTLSPKPALVGLSRGGLYVYNWAAANPDKVSCIYGDATVCDFKSWPGGFGKGKRSDRDWNLILTLHGFKNDDEANAYKLNPVDNLAPLAKAGVPLLHVFGDADEVVPWEENTGLIEERYKALGGSITLIRKPGVQHHPHGLDDSTPIIDFIWRNTASAKAREEWAAHGGGPLDADSKPLIRKLGTIDLDLVETTPVVFGGKLWRFEWVRHGTGQPYWNNRRETNYFRFRNPETGDVTAPFADGYEFGSAFVQGDTVYVTGTLNHSQVDLFASTDLKAWRKSSVIPAGRYGIFNTSMCKSDKGYVLMFEIDKPVEEAGKAFTARFATSPDLQTWTMTPPECNYSKDRYTAPHCLRWDQGWFYDFYLEAYQGYEMRVVRSRDLIHWESSPINPVLRASSEDKLIANPQLTEGQRSRIANAVNLNNSDIDFCEFNGQLRINYSWGNQQGVEHLAEAIYDGSEAQFLRGWFP